MNRLEYSFGWQRSRPRTEVLRASLFQESANHLRWPGVRRIGLDFGWRDPVTVLYRLLQAEGLSDPEELRQRFTLPDKPLLCRPDPRQSPRRTAGARSRASRRPILEDALWLGLATPWVLDPARPVLWTRASLTRRLEVHEAEGFYA